MATKRKRRPFSFALKILIISFLLFMNFIMIIYTVGTVYDEIIWGERLSVPNVCEWDLTEGNYLRMYDTLWLYMETGEETRRFWRIAYAYEDMIDCITYRQAAKLGFVTNGGAGYEKLAEDALTEINEAAKAAEAEQDRLILEFFAAETAKPFPRTLQNK